MTRAGAKGKYDPKQTPQLILDFTLKYATDIEIAKALGIHYTTYYRWLKDHPDLQEVITHAKRIRAQKLVPKLKKRAEGFTYKEVTIEELEGVTDSPRRLKTVKKHYPPDVGALKFLLTNGLPDEYRNKQELEHHGEIQGGASVMVYLPDNERDTKEEQP